MAAFKDSRITELKRQISLLRNEEERLRWIISSEFVSDKLKDRARRDLQSVLENLFAAGHELKQLEEVL
ncbi:hypothetical protein [Occallatibacter savannae]|uniref:hypothetical protein n=1 Tax=Occallatibacter savannae TaxID=1002691 RepID=UPI000D68F875|nr:hypothetical protein [Occallatibacter savannae]